MKNEKKKRWQVKAFFLLLVAFSANANYVLMEGSSVLMGSCPSPVNVCETAKTVNSVAFTWEVTTCSTTTRIWYVRADDGSASQAIETTGNSVSFANLSPGTYCFYFQNVCDSGASATIVIDDLMMG